MGLLSMLFGKKTASGATRSDRTYIIDASSIGSKSKMSPGDQLNLLRRYARFAGTEKISISTVFEGKPLRKVDHGGTFEGMKVYFAASPDARSTLIVKLLKERLRKSIVTVITADQKVEKRVIASNGNTLRMSTFAKALDGGSGGNGERTRRNRRPQRPRRNDNRNRPPRNDAKDTVHGLIDLVD